MLVTQAFLRGVDDLNKITFKPKADDPLEVLKEQYGIKYTIWENLVVLNYCQIESSKYKFSDIVRECRSLVLEMGTWDVVSRSFDRFFNEGEDPDLEYNINDLVAYEKVDGSLVTFFNYKGRSLYRTKSMIMPDTVINNNINGVTWKTAIESALGSLEPSDMLDDWSYIMELVCDENRVVTRYNHGVSVLYPLAIRHNKSGVYQGHIGQSCFCDYFALEEVKQFEFDTLDHCLDSAKALRNLQEGYVLYTQKGVPIVKVKNPAYVAAHHLRGEGVLTEKRVLNLIVMNEYDEYLSIFPEDIKAFEPYIDAQSILTHELGLLEQEVKLLASKTQKEFAMEVKDRPTATIAFKLRAGMSLEDALNSLSEKSRHTLILNYKVYEDE